MAEDPDESTLLDLPAHLANAVRRASERSAEHIEADIAPVVASAYRAGWAAGYLARHRETANQGEPT